MKGLLVKRKQALTLEDLGRVIYFYACSCRHDDLLFVTMLLTGFFALLCLGELCFPDDKSIRDWRKLVKRASVIIHEDFYKFLLPHHKADHYFEGNHVIMHKDQFQHDPLFHFHAYLDSRDRLFLLTAPLWLTEGGQVPSRSFFTRRLGMRSTVLVKRILQKNPRFESRSRSVEK